jgi:hypothetical protein
MPKLSVDLHALDIVVWRERCREVEIVARACAVVDEANDGEGDTDCMIGALKDGAIAFLLVTVEEGTADKTPYHR